MKTIGIILGVLIVLIAPGCGREKNDCKAVSYAIKPFAQKYAKFECSNNDEYTYILRRSTQIDSLGPQCYFIGPVVFPIDESYTRYFLIGRTSYFRRDTFTTVLLQDSCSKTLTYEVNMVQRDTTNWQFPGVMSMFCAVENISNDYNVQIKYKFVPL